MLVSYTPTAVGATRPQQLELHACQLHYSRYACQLHAYSTYAILCRYTPTRLTRLHALHAYTPIAQMLVCAGTRLHALHAYTCKPYTLLKGCQTLSLLQLGQPTYTYVYVYLAVQLHALQAGLALQLDRQGLPDAIATI
jgi:hypothetical protein